MTQLAKVVFLREEHAHSVIARHYEEATAHVIEARTLGDQIDNLHKEFCRLRTEEHNLFMQGALAHHESGKADEYSVLYEDNLNQRKQLQEEVSVLLAKSKEKIDWINETFG